MKVLIQINDLSKRYGSRVLFDGAQASFHEREKIGVIGRNGAGKSTLMRILSGQEEADSGMVTKNRDLRLGYLEQKDPFHPGERVLDFLMRYTGRESWMCGKVAGRFRLKNEMLEKPIGDLAGGYQMRVKLCAMLLFEPNFLLLDEPTNYLDLQTLLLLESFLQDYNGGFLLISHDREFLKRTCEHTLDVENGDLYLYPGALEEYLVFKDERKELIERRNRNIEARQREIQSFIERFRAKSSKASLVQSRVKQLQKMDQVEILHEAAKVNIRIPAVQERKGIALRAEELSVGYPGRTVAAEIRFAAERGEHIVVLGENGQGKTTLLKTIAGEIPPLQGSIMPGKEIRVGYFAQHVYTALNPEEDAITYLTSHAAPGVTRQEILDMAGAFLFQGDDVKKKISVLSGGERSRLALAGLLLGKYDLLLLDEPTNHLDFDTVESLGMALRGFAGTILLVSHDRTFVHLVATNILEVRGGHVVHFPGTYDEYLFRLEREAKEGGDSPDKAASFAVMGRKPAGEEKTGKGKPENEGIRVPPGKEGEGEAEQKSRYHRKKELQSESNRALSALKRLEAEVAALEKEKIDILSFYEANPGAYSPEKNDRMEELTELLSRKEEEWFSLQERSEAIRAELEAL